MLSGVWSDVTAFNYAIDPFALRPFVPSGTELDFFQDETFVSVVALHFERPRWLGAMPVLFHSRFPMVTFRFYVKRRMRDGSYRHGTAFLKEFTPLRSVSTIGRMLGKRDFQKVPVSANVFRGSKYLFWWGRIADGNWMDARVSGEPTLTTEGSFEDFILEKPWDFVAVGTRKTLQYRAVHPRWKVWRADDSEARIDIDGVLPGDIARALARPPKSVFIAEGSRVKMGFPRAFSVPRRISSYATRLDLISTFPDSKR